MGGSSSKTMVMTGLNEVVNESVTNLLQRNSTDITITVGARQKLSANNITFGAGCTNTSINQNIDIETMVQVDSESIVLQDLASTVSADLSTAVSQDQSENTDIFGTAFGAMSDMFGTNDEDTTVESTIKNKVKNSIKNGITQEDLTEILQQYTLANIMELEDITYDPCGSDIIIPYLSDDDSKQEFLKTCMDSQSTCVIDQNIGLNLTAQAITKKVIDSMQTLITDVESKIIADQDQGKETSFFGNMDWGQFAIIAGIILLGIIILMMAASAFKHKSTAASAPAAAPVTSNKV